MRLLSRDDCSHRVRQDNVPMKEKLDQILAWIDMPLETRPQFITGTRHVAVTTVLIDMAYCSVRALP